MPQIEEMDVWSASDLLCVTLESEPADPVKDICLVINISYDNYLTSGRTSSLLNNYGYMWFRLLFDAF